jgi:hypothetical protein
MKQYKFELKYEVVVDIEAVDQDAAQVQIEAYILANPGPSTPSIKLSAQEPVEE